MSITIVTGPPGAGKTTVAAHLAGSSRLGVHLVGDQVFRWIVAGYVPPWMPRTSRQNAAVISATAAAAVQFVNGGYDVFVDAIIGPWFLPHWLDVVEDRGPTHYFVLRPSRRIALARAVGREASDELVDPQPVGRMFDAFEDLGTFETHVLDSSSQDVDTTVAAVQKGIVDGRYVVKPSDGGDDMVRLSVKFGIDPPSEDRSG